MSCFTCFATEFVRVDDFVVLTGDTQPFTFILAQFQVDIPGAFFEVFKVSMQRKCYDLVRRPYYCQNQKEKLDSRHCNDVWETLIYQRQKFGK